MEKDRERAIETLSSNPPATLEGAGISWMERIKGTENISIREAARILGISYSTAWRYFEAGILTGERHPITGQHSVNKNSVLALMKKYGMKWKE